MSFSKSKRIAPTLLLLLGLGLAGAAGYGVHTWLKPKPLWVYSPEDSAQGKSNLGIVSLSNDGHWMLVGKYGRFNQTSMQLTILDRQTGQPVPGVDLSKIDMKHNHGNIHDSQPFTLTKDSLWWFASEQVRGENIIKLMRLPFLGTKQAEEVHSWRFPVQLCGYVRCIETDQLHIVFQFRTCLEQLYMYYPR